MKSAPVIESVIPIPILGLLLFIMYFALDLAWVLFKPSFKLATLYHCPVSCWRTRFGSQMIDWYICSYDGKPQTTSVNQPQETLKGGYMVFQMWLLLVYRSVVVKIFSGRHPSGASHNPN